MGGPVKNALLKERLGNCDDWVRRAFADLVTVCSAAAPIVKVQSASRGEGLTFYIAFDDRPFCRIDPKQKYLGVGYHNIVRDDVQRTGLLRAGRPDRAWIFVRNGDDLTNAIKLVDKAAGALKTGCHPGLKTLPG